MRITATITEKGQITIPKAVRELIHGKIVEFVVSGQTIELRQAPSVAGMLAEYAPEYIPFEEAREKTWDELDGKN